MSFLARSNSGTRRGKASDGETRGFAEDFQLALALDLSEEEQEIQRAIAISLQEKELKELSSSPSSGDFAQIFGSTGLSSSSSWRKEHSLASTAEEDGDTRAGITDFRATQEKAAGSSRVLEGRRRIQRTLSTEEPTVAHLIRKRVGDCLVRSNALTFFQDQASAPHFTLRLPKDIQMTDNILDKEMQDKLEKAGALNFLEHEGNDVKVSKLYCLKTDGDGNCLLHALSLAVWGVHDRGLSKEIPSACDPSSSGLLREALYRSLTAPLSGPIFREVWKSETEARLILEGAGETYDEEQWNREWAAVVDAAYKPSAFLYEIHVFALAHSLRRPVIIYGEPVVRSPATQCVLGPDFVHGIYLPLLWGEPEFCWRTPVALAYAPEHFTACTYKQGQGSEPALLPIEIEPGRLLPLRFAIPGSRSNVRKYSAMELIRQWMDPARPWVGSRRLCVRSTVTMPPTNSVKETLRVTEDTLRRLGEKAKPGPGAASNGSTSAKGTQQPAMRWQSMKALEQGPMSKIPSRAPSTVVSTKPLSFVPASLIDM